MLVAAALAAIAVLATGDGPWVIPPGREAFLAEVLGNEPPLPVGCVCRKVEIPRDLVRATYDCPDRPSAVLELRHREAPGAGARTARFALLPERPDEFPPPLLRALRARIEAREEAWTWIPAGEGAFARTAPVQWPLAPAAATVAVLAALAVALLDRRRARRAPPAAPRPAPVLRRTDVLAAATVLAAAVALPAMVMGEAPLHLDTSRDLLVARDLLAGRPVSPVVPTSSSWSPLVHGAPWIRLLAVAISSGAPLPFSRVAVLVLQALSVALVFHAARRLAGAWAAAAAAALQLSVALVVTEAPVLWNPSILPLPVALSGLALVATVRSGGMTAALVAGVAVGIGAQAHVLTLVLVPVLLAGVAATADRPGLTSLAAAAATVAAFTVGNGPAAASLVQAAAEDPGLAAVPLAAIAIGAAARPRARAAPVERRTVVALVVLAVVPLAGTVALGAAARHPLAPRHFLSLLAAAPLAAAVLGARSLAAVPRRGAAAMVAGVTVTVVAALIAASASAGDPPRRRATPPWTLADAAALAPVLSADGWTYAELHRHLRSPDRPRDLLAAVAAFGAASRADEGGPSRVEDLLVVKVRAEDARDPPPEWRVVPLAGGWAAIARPLPAALRWDDFDVCLSEAAQGGAWRWCGKGSLETTPSEKLAARAYPGVALASRPPRMPAPPYAVEFTAAAVPGGAPARRLETTAEQDCLVAWAGAGAGRAHSLTVDAVVAGARVAFSCDAAGVAAADWIPAYVETSPDEQRLRALLAPWLARPDEPQRAAAPWRSR